MKRILYYLVVLTTAAAFSQDDENLKVRETVDTFFEGFHLGDTTIMKSVLADKVLLQTAFKKKEGQDILVTDDLQKLIHAVANRPADEKWDERLLNYTIKIDGNMANAWTPYEFWFNGTFSHCGVNSFQLFKNGEQWKIIYLMDTRRRKGCENQ
ncbi:nuclear transport factor 2 family protein [Aestuariivivens sediminis]|uniref:nuclear transport factor 2 family protein n=1 Tax=Aestuariivivens sediminis TaxID=2913557 RepID=UPI001F569A5F|nr:nuclear transport factor 2 family protein [Aestuariivivens sediminis]